MIGAHQYTVAIKAVVSREYTPFPLRHYGRQPNPLVPSLLLLSFSIFSSPANIFLKILKNGVHGLMGVALLGVVSMGGANSNGVGWGVVNMGGANFNGASLRVWLRSHLIIFSSQLEQWRSCFLC